MNSTQTNQPRAATAAPYFGYLEFGPDRIYNGPTIRLDLSGYGGAVELGFTGCTMAENPQAYAEWIINACNSHAALHSLAILCNAYLEPISDQLEICHKQPDEAKALRQLLGIARAALSAAQP